MQSSPSRVSDTNLAGVVEISNMPRMFYTAAYGAPDMLFFTMLTSARESYAATARGALQQQEAGPLKPGFCAETYMAGLLLRDQNFVPARVLRNYAHHYTLDFDAGAIYLRTELYAVQQQSTSLFSVKLGGHILESTFVVRDAATDRVLTQVSEEELLKPNFFTHELPFLSYHARLDPGLAASGGTASLVDQDFQLQLGVTLGNTVNAGSQGQGRTEGTGARRGDGPAPVRSPAGVPQQSGEHARNAAENLGGQSPRGRWVGVLPALGCRRRTWPDALPLDAKTNEVAMVSRSLRLPADQTDCLYQQ